MVKSQPATATLDTLAQAVTRGRQVSMVYVNKRGDRDTRTVDPLAVESRDDVWFLRAWCHTRSALRTFRVDRIEELTMTEREIGRHDDVLLPEQWSVFSPSEADLVVTIEFAPQTLPVITEYLDRASAPTPHGSVLRSEVRFAHAGSLTRFVAKYPGLVTVVGPADARQAVGLWAAQALTQYR
jgi:proteasome accessory factor C